MVMKYSLAVIVGTCSTNTVCCRTFFQGITQVVPKQHVAISSGLTPDRITQVVPIDHVLVVRPDKALSEIIQVAPTQQLVKVSPYHALEDIIQEW